MAMADKSLKTLPLLCLHSSIIAHLQLFPCMDENGDSSHKEPELTLL